ncbi:hypothetical protein ACQ4PT_052272 [Festuca glaucescens]
MSPTMSRLHINGRLYVDDMAPGTGDADLRRHFGLYGDVANIFIPTCRLTGKPRCCAFVQFSSPRDAGCVLADPCHVINGREVHIARARPRARPRHSEESSVGIYSNTSMSPAMGKLHLNGRLYLDDMAPGTGDVDLRSHFGRYGDVADIFIPTYRLNGQPRCCAFVQFSNPGDAGRALADQPHVINGREVPMSTSFAVSSFSRIMMNDCIVPVLPRITSENAELIFREVLPRNE